MRLICFWLMVLSVCVSSSFGDDWPGFRGADRQDVSKETGLLKEWPKGGPKRLWMFEKAGVGYSGFAIVDGRLFFMGTRDDEAILFAVNAATGEELWTAKIGEIYENKWGDGPRGTPSVVDGMVYALGSAGDVVCVRADDGTQLWRRNLTEFGGKVPYWGYSESPLVDSGRVIATPGGAGGTLVALNAKTGDLEWQSDDVGEPANYSSPIKATIHGQEQYIQLTPKMLFSVAADTGALLWQTPWRGKIAVIPTPIVRGNQVYISSGYGVGCKKVTINSDQEVDVEYENKVMKNHHGGVILIGDHLYGYSDGVGWVCQDFKTGEKVWNEKDKLGKGAIGSADGMIYCLDERSGAVVLAQASAKGWKEQGRFKLSPQTKIRKDEGGIWAHPVIANGRLYLRDQDLIYCYDVKAK